MCLALPNASSKCTLRRELLMKGRWVFAKYAGRSLRLANARHAAKSCATLAAPSTSAPEGRCAKRVMKKSGLFRMHETFRKTVT